MEQGNTKIGRKPEVDETVIIEAAQQLVDNGNVVSGWKLRNIISRGNPTRLMKVWESHLAKNGDLVPIVDSSDESGFLPPEIDEGLKVLLGGLVQDIESIVLKSNNAAIRAADKRVASEYAASKQAKEQAEQELAEAEVALTHADNNSDSLEKKLAELEKEFRDLSGKYQSSKTIAQSLDEQLKVITTERDEFEGRCDFLNEENTQYRVDISTLKNSNAQIESEMKMKVECLAVTEKALLDASQRQSKLEGLLESSQIDNDRISNKNDELESKVEMANNKLITMSQDLGKVKSELETSKADAFNLDESIKRLECESQKMKEDYVLKINSLEKKV